MDDIQINEDEFKQLQFLLNINQMDNADNFTMTLEGKIRHLTE